MSERLSMQDLWQKRYGCDLPDGVPEVADFLQHASYRKFLNKPVDESIVAGLVAAAQSAATSSHLMCWSMLSVQDPDRRSQIAEMCGNQKQVLEAPWFFAFFADLNRGRLAAQAAGIEPDAMDTAEAFIVSVVDCALAAERMVCAAESLGLGICYIGALRNEPERLAELLHLPSHVFGVFGLCIGWPDPSDNRAEVKPRLSQDAVWYRETYPSQVSVEEFDQRMKAPLQAMGIENPDSWSYRQGRRLSMGYLSGREHLMRYLNSRGLNRR